jgi:hypothetical protein
MTRISNVLKGLVAATPLAIVIASAGYSSAADRAAAIHECSVRGSIIGGHP